MSVFYASRAAPPGPFERQSGEAGVRGRTAGAGSRAAN